jgi:hypothetical protein
MQQQDNWGIGWTHVSIEDVQVVDSGGLVMRGILLFWGSTDARHMLSSRLVFWPVRIFTKLRVLQLFRQD